MRYPNVSDIRAMHTEIMALYNQPSLLRDKGEASIEAALMRPQMAAYYEDADLAKQTALLITGIAQAHPFVDGNKRISLAAGAAMLLLNGYVVQSGRIEFAKQIVNTITSDEENALGDFAEWIRSKLEPLGETPDSA